MIISRLNICNIMMSVIIIIIIGIIFRTTAIQSYPWTLENNNEILQELNTINYNREKLFSYASEIFCRSHLKVVYVYYENETSLSYPGQILKLMNSCGISHVVIRNKYRQTSLEVLRDDGIQMHLIMVLRDISQTVELSILQKKSAAKHLTFILLLIENSKTVTEEWLHKTFDKFWHIWMLQVVIMFSQREIIFVYRYDYFSRELIRRSVVGRYYIGLDELYPQGLYNMQKKPLRMCLYRDDIRAIFLNGGRLLGSDGLMSEYMAERLNATAEVDRIRIYGNTSDSRDLCFKEIFNEFDDLATNMRFLSLLSFDKKVEHSIVLARDDLCVMVPKAAIASTFWNLFRTFGPKVWTLILGCLMLAYIFCVSMFRRYLPGNNLLLDLLSCMISAPVVVLRRPTISLRIFVVFWLVYGLLISVAFKANLTSNLVQRDYLPDVDTLKELAESSFPLATLPRHVKHLQRYLDPKNPYELMIKNKIVEIPDQHFNDLIESNNQSYAYLQKYHVSMFRANSRKHSYKGKPLYHVMSQCIVPFHAVYIVPYGSPYLGNINILMRSAQEYGLLQHWNTVMSAVFRRFRKNAFLNRKTDDEPVVLKLNHFQATFFLLICGLLLSMLTFIMELLYINIMM